MINVHSHYKLKCPEDKLFVVTCGRPGFFSPTSGKLVFADLQLLEEGKPTSAVNVGNKHKSLALRLKLSDQSQTYDIRVKNCFCYSSIASFFQLTDENGCAIHSSMGPSGITFPFKRMSGEATAGLLYIPVTEETRRLYFTCQVDICENGCPRRECYNDDSKNGKQDGGIESSGDDGSIYVNNIVNIARTLDEDKNVVVPEGGIIFK